MDSKVLESLMIPEYEIATEGIGSKIMNIFKNSFRIIMNVINTIIKFINNIINKLKLKKTIHNDRETYLKNRKLSKKYYETIKDLLYFIPNYMELIITNCFTVNTYNIRYDKENLHNRNINDIDNEYNELKQKFENMKNDIKDNKLYFLEFERNTIINSLEKTKIKMQKIAEMIKTSIDNQIGDSDTLANTKTQDEINEQQKRISEFTSYVTKYQSLFANVEKFIMNNVSSDVITDKDIVKYEYNIKTD